MENFNVMEAVEQLRQKEQQELEAFFKSGGQGAPPNFAGGPQVQKPQSQRMQNAAAVPGMRVDNFGAPVASPRPGIPPNYGAQPHNPGVKAAPQARRYPDFDDDFNPRPQQKQEKRQQPPRNFNQPKAKKSGSGFSGVRNFVSTGDIDWPRAIPHFVRLAVVIIIMFYAGWLFLLGMAQWGFVKVNATNPLQFLTSSPWFFILGVAAYMLITRIEMECWPEADGIGDFIKQLFTTPEGWLLLFVGGIDYGNIQGGTVKIVGNTNFTFWVTDIHLPKGEWYTTLIGMAIGFIITFGLERIFIYQGRKFLETIGH